MNSLLFILVFFPISILGDELAKDEIIIENQSRISSPKVDSLSERIMILADSMRQSNKNSWWEIYGSFIGSLLGIIGAIFTVCLAYWLNIRHTKSLRQESNRILSNALINEVNDAVERCCYIVECQAIGRVSNTSLPKASREYLMSHFSQVTRDDNLLIALTRIYNILDRIIIHQDEAVKSASEQDLEKAIASQGKATAFIRDYLDDLISLIGNITKKEDGSNLQKRHGLIKSTSLIEYLVIARFYHKFGDEITKKEYEDEADHTDLVRFVVDVLNQQLGRSSPMPDYNNKGKQIIESLQENYFDVSTTGTKLKLHTLQMIEATSWAGLRKNSL